MKTLPLVPLLVWCLLTAAAGPTPAAPLGKLMQACGYRYVGPDAAGVYNVNFAGDKMPLIKVRVQAMGSGAEQAICAVCSVQGVTQAGCWDPAVFPWLLERSWRLPRGAFALADGGRQVIYFERLPLGGLTGAALGECISAAVLAVDEAAPQVQSYVRH